MIKKLSIYMVLLFSVPLTTWLIGYRWEGEQIYFIDTFLLFLSELIEYPYTLFICIILMFWLIWLVRKQHSWLLVSLICASSIISMHELKEASKSFFTEPRPYIHYFLKENANTFYQIPSKDERFNLIKSYVRKGELTKYDQHRISNQGFSFPSGHTIFTDSWLFIFVGFLYGLRGFTVTFSLIFLSVLSLLMAISRIRLGMHFPIDIMASTIISYLYHLIVFVFVVPFLSKWKIFGYKWFKKQH